MLPSFKFSPPFVSIIISSFSVVGVIEIDDILFGTVKLYSNTSGSNVKSIVWYSPFVLIPFNI